LNEGFKNGKNHVNSILSTRVKSEQLENSELKEKEGLPHTALVSLGHDVVQSLSGYEIGAVTNQLRRFSVLENTFCMAFEMREKRRLALPRFSVLCQSCLYRTTSRIFV
jgi:hypothetical protein